MAGIRSRFFRLGVLRIGPAAIEKDGKSAETVLGSSLLCYWAIRELGMTAEAVSMRARLTESGVIRAE